MKAGTVKVRRTTSVIAAALAFWAAAAAADNLVVQGKLRAIESCSACHQVMAAQPRPAPVFDPDENRSIQAPTFRRIASEYGQQPRLLRKLITNPRHPMREQQFLADDLRSIVAFIQSLAQNAPNASQRPVR